MPPSTSLVSTDSENAIRRVLRNVFGPAASVISLEPYDYATSYPLYRAVVEVAAKRLELIIKDTGQSVAEAALSGKPGFLYHPLREVLVYRDVLSQLRLGTPTFYGFTHDAQIKHVHAVFE